MRRRPGLAAFLLALGIFLAAGYLLEQRAEASNGNRARNGVPIRVLGVHYRSRAQSARIVIDLDAEPPFKTNTLSHPSRLYVDLFGTQLAPDLKGKVIPVKSSVVRRARLAQNRPGVVRVVLDLRKAGKHRVFSLPDPARIVIDVNGAGGGSPSRQKARASRPAAERLHGRRGRPWRIIIDPGHGGKDPGAIGPGGLEEKNVVLDIALRVKRLLEATGRYQILLTRSKDVFVPLEERTAFANSHKADLFVSIHANASTRSSLRGVATYRLGINPDEDATELAARENRGSRRKLSDVEMILKDLLLTSKSNDSILLAQDVQSQLVKETRQVGREAPPDLGIREALFYVLVGAEMPAVLAEVSFITNPEGEKLLRTASYREKLAEGIARGVEEYLEGASVVADRAP